MKHLINRLWRDDRGALFAAEYLIVATIVGIGVTVGLTGVRNAVNDELTELGNAYLSISQGFGYSGQKVCCAYVDGSQSVDTPGLLTPPVCTAPSIPSFVDGVACRCPAE